jgi:hypothetical protein
MDLNETLGRALNAAKRGDMDGVEVELSRVQNLPAEAIVGLRVKLRGLARSARAHPSFRHEPAAQAG